MQVMVQEERIVGYCMSLPKNRTTNLKQCCQKEEETNTIYRRNLEIMPKYDELCLSSFLSQSSLHPSFFFLFSYVFSTFKVPVAYSVRALPCVFVRYV